MTKRHWYRTITWSNRYKLNFMRGINQYSLIWCPFVKIQWFFISICFFTSWKIRIWTVVSLPMIIFFHARSSFEVKKLFSSYIKGSTDLASLLSLPTSSMGIIHFSTEIGTAHSLLMEFNASWITGSLLSQLNFAIVIGINLSGAT